MNNVFVTGTDGSIPACWASLRTARGTTWEMVPMRSTVKVRVLTGSTFISILTIRIATSKESSAMFALILLKVTLASALIVRSLANNLQ